MSAHTPGPWVIERIEGSNQFVIRGNVSRNRNGILKRIAAIGCPRPMASAGLAEDEANARLIAASPELLKAAKTVLAGLNARIEAGKETGKLPVFDGIADLHSAIRKAEAEGRQAEP